MKDSSSQAALSRGTCQQARTAKVRYVPTYYVENFGCRAALVCRQPIDHTESTGSQSGSAFSFIE